jgi:peptidoglycan/LPS O-acetylase OafA/YrhL
MSDQRVEAPAGVRPTTTYLPEIESLRGIAIALVYAVHLDLAVYSPFAARDPRASIWYAYVRSGQTGVDLFFMLSGFLLSLPFLKMVDGGPPVRMSQYFRRRALRILPLYWLAVLIGAALTATEWRDLLRSLPYLFFLNSFAGLTTSLHPYSNVWWSLATEVQFYLLLPLLPFALRSRAGRYTSAALLLGYAVAYAGFLTGRIGVGSYVGQHKLEQSIFGRAVFFLIGILVAWIYQRFGRRLRARFHARSWVRNGGADVALLAVLLALGALLRWTVAVGWLHLDLPPYHAWHLMEALLWGAILFLILFAPLRSKPLLCNRFFTYLGVISYSLYLIHYPIFAITMQRLYIAKLFDGAGWTPRGVLIALLMTATCLGLSTLSYRFIERPFLVRKARIGR